MASGFHLQALHHHVLVAGARLDVKMIRQGFEARAQKAHKPLESDPDSATNTAP
jgi:hypothetical protein